MFDEEGQHRRSVGVILVTRNKNKNYHKHKAVAAKRYCLLFSSLSWNIRTISIFIRFSFFKLYITLIERKSRVPQVPPITGSSFHYERRPRARMTNVRLSTLCNFL